MTDVSRGWKTPGFRDEQPLDPGLLHTRLSTRNFTVKRYLPRPELRGLISHHAVLEWDLGDKKGFTPQALDKPGAGIVWDRDAIVFHGPKTHLYSYPMQGRGRIYGHKFSPAGATVLINTRMRELVNLMFPIQDIVSGWTTRIGEDPADHPDHELTIREIEQQLLACGLRPTPEQQLADEIVNYIAEQPQVFTTQAVAEAFGMHVRSLQLLISRQVGPGVKWIIRQFRIFEALAAFESGRPVNLGTLAYDLGYSSQSHFTNHFKRMTNVSPGEYMKAYERSETD